MSNFLDPEKKTVRKEEKGHMFNIMTPLHCWPHCLSLKSKWLPRYRDRRFQMSCKAFFSGIILSPYITLRLGKCLIKVRISYLLYLKLLIMQFFLKLCDRMQFEVNCAKLYHHVISDGLHGSQAGKMGPSYSLWLNFLTIDLSYYTVCPENATQFLIFYCTLSEGLIQLNKNIFVLQATSRGYFKMQKEEKLNSN